MPAQTARLSLRIDLPNGGRLGPGKAALMREIHKGHSISGAARALGMSYPRAWKLVNTLNADFSETLVETFQGGVERGGARLTLAGEHVLALYEHILTAAETASEDELGLLAKHQAGLAVNTEI